MAACPAIAALALPALSVTPTQASSAKAGVARTSVAGQEILNYQSKLCLDVNSSKGVIQATCDGSTTQLWQVDGENIVGQGTLDPTYYYSYINTGDGECLGVSGDSTAEGAAADVQTCKVAADAPDQFWTYETLFVTCERGGVGYYPMDNENSSYFLSVVGNSDKSGALIDMQSNRGGCTTQDWYAPGG
jgi:hypothetical protein